MSYEDTRCVCGGKKLTQTLFCQDCFGSLSGRPEMTMLLSDSDVGSRRHAALILLSLARGRNTTRKEPAYVG